MIRVAVIGAHGTGKTTLVSALTPVAPGPVAAIQGIPRRLIKEGYSFGEQMELDAVAAYYAEQRRREINAARHGVVTLLTERTLLDAVAYERANTTLYGRPAFSAEVRLFITRTAFDHINTYDLLVYCPIHFPLEDDGIRGFSTEYQSTVDHMLSSLMTDDSMTVPSMTVQGSIESRVRQVLERLQV